MTMVRALISRRAFDRSPDEGSLGRVGPAILVLSGTGFPLTQVAIARFGRRGALLVQAVVVGLLMRDLLLIASGAPSRLQPGPAVLLWTEATAAAAAATAGALLLRDPEVATARQAGWAVPRGELFRRVAIGTLFGLHTLRFRTYLSPGSGLRRPIDLGGHRGRGVRSPGAA